MFKHLSVILSLFFLCLICVPHAHAQFTIFGEAYPSDGLAQGWTNGSLYNGVNTWNIIDTEIAYSRNHSLSWANAAPFERGWVVSPTALNLSQYQYLTFYARSKQVGQRYEVGFVDASGGMVGTWVSVDTGGGSLQPDRWQVYNFPLSTFNVTTQAFGIGLRDMNGAPQPKVFLDEILLTNTPASAPIISPAFGQPVAPTNPPKPKGPYYPRISPWVFIIPAVIIALAIFFE